MATEGAKSHHDAIFWSSGGQLAVRRGNWKLVKDGKVFDGTPDGNKASDRRRRAVPFEPGRGPGRERESAAPLSGRGG